MYVENNKNQASAFGWDDVIENDGTPLIVLDEGVYEFTVKGFERDSFPGSEKLPPCPKAALTLQVTVPEGVAIIHVDLLLCKRMEWRLSAFFRSIGMKKHGERLVMDWSKVKDSFGHAHFRPREYIDADGNVRTTNELVKFLDPPENQRLPVSNESVKDDDDGDADLPF